MSQSSLNSWLHFQTYGLMLWSLLQSHHLPLASGFWYNKDCGNSMDFTVSR